MNDEITIKLKIAINIKKLRDANNLSARELARRANIGEKMVRRMESVDYEFMPSISSLIKIANVLGVEIVTLLS